MTIIPALSPLLPIRHRASWSAGSSPQEIAITAIVIKNPPQDPCTTETLSCLPILVIQAPSGRVRIPVPFRTLKFASWEQQRMEIEMKNQRVFPNYFHFNVASIFAVILNELCPCQDGKIAKLVTILNEHWNKMQCSLNFGTAPTLSPSGHHTGPTNTCWFERKELVKNFHFFAK